MRATIIVILMAAILLGCEKEERIARRLTGDWYVMKLRMVTRSKEVCDSLVGDYEWDETYESTLYNQGRIRFERDRKEGEMTGSFFINRPSTARTSEYPFHWAYEFTYAIRGNEDEIIEMEGRYSDSRTMQFEIIELSNRKLKLHYSEEPKCASSIITMWCEKD